MRTAPAGRGWGGRWRRATMAAKPPKAWKAFTARRKRGPEPAKPDTMSPGPSSLGSNSSATTDSSEDSSVSTSPVGSSSSWSRCMASSITWQADCTIPGWPLRRSEQQASRTARARSSIAPEAPVSCTRCLCAVNRNLGSASSTTKAVSSGDRRSWCISITTACSCCTAPSGWTDLRPCSISTSTRLISSRIAPSVIARAPAARARDGRAQR
mmetsp:Transcript_17414/g.58344  ORF Transcript_17414/g.58344 Transcript_17414/m.58344 type:complete len:212 (-) Transcript_17414:7-642(-)